MKSERPVITLDPPWWRCENGCEFRCKENKPKSCPVCGSVKIEMVVEVDEKLRKPRTPYTK